MYTYLLFSKPSKFSKGITESKKKITSSNKCYQECTLNEGKKINYLPLEDMHTSGTCQFSPLIFES
jgi:hypothetical protein